MKESSLKKRRRQKNKRERDEGKEEGLHGERREPSLFTAL